jgi:hypothetical protein
MKSDGRGKWLKGKAEEKRRREFHQRLSARVRYVTHNA